MKSICFILSLFSYLCFSCQNTASLKWQEGDILFQDGDCGDFCEAIKKVTHGYAGRDFSHNGILMREDGEWFVLEAISKGVVQTPLNDFLQRHINEVGKPKIIVGRLLPRYQKLIPAAIEEAKKQLGKPYDFAFNITNDAYYCSELIHLSLQRANQGTPVFELKPMTYKDPATGELFPIWEAYFENLGIPVPEGEPGLNPGGMSLDPAIEIVLEMDK